MIFGHVIWVDKYIIQISHDTDIQKIGENAIHELLEGYGSIGKIEGYYKPLKYVLKAVFHSSLLVMQTKW